mgnify:CR=1 FL=1
MINDQLILATRNKDKIVEIEQLLEDFDLSITTASEFADLPETVEDQDTLRGNAIKKAKEVLIHTGIPSLADDTGLEVDALDGRPGVFSARYAGEEASYSNNVTKLLDELKDIDSEQRTARFRTVAALALEKKVYLFDGVCNGFITEKPSGTGGFGYDPVFKPEGHEQTFAELDAAAKNTISHRGRALNKLKAFLAYHAD